jgi:hypothetical protein
MPDPLDMTLRELLAALAERLSTAESVAPDPWEDIQGTPLKRRLVRAAARGEVQLHRIGRQLLIRRSERDRWIEKHAISATKRRRERLAPAEGEFEPRVAQLIGYGYSQQEALQQASVDRMIAGVGLRATGSPAEDEARHRRIARMTPEERAAYERERAEAAQQRAHEEASARARRGAETRRRNQGERRGGR